jgi:hypothetical protein
MIGNVNSRPEKISAVVLLLALCTLTSLAQTVPERGRLDRLRSEGYEALYNLEYERARSIFKEMTRLFPDHPAGLQSLAATVWLEELNRARHLQASLYSSDALQERSEKVDPRTVDQFRSLVREAKSLSQARLRRDSNDLEALYFLGAADGLQAVFTAGVEQRYRAALGDSSRSVERHKEVIKRDPDFHDAELTIGLYNYVVGSLPLPVKLVASIAGVRGSKKRGLEMLERVADKGDWARDMARTLLIDIYKREKRWADAADISRELAIKYPRNYIFRLQTADALVAQAKQEQTEDANETKREALRIFETLLRGGEPENVTARRLAIDLIHFRYGEALLATGDPRSASEEFLTAAGSSTELSTLARLRAAQSLDVAGQRAKAVTEYRRVLERPNVRRSHDEARRGLRESYRQSN